MLVHITIVPWIRIGNHLRQCNSPHVPTSVEVHGCWFFAWKWRWGGKNGGFRAPNKAAVLVLFPKSQMFWKWLGYHIVYLYKHIADICFWNQINLSWGIRFLCKCCKSHCNKVQEFNAGLAWNPWILRMELDLRVAGITLMVPWRWRSRKFVVSEICGYVVKTFLVFRIFEAMVLRN